MLKDLDIMPDDPAELRAVNRLLADEVKSQALLIEKLKHQLAGQNHHRFGVRSESLDQLNLTFEEDEAIAEAAEEQARPEVPTADDKSPRQHSRKPGSHGSLPKSPIIRSHASTSSSPGVTLLKQRNRPHDHSKGRAQRTGTHKLLGVLKERGLNKWQLPVMTAIDRSANRYAERLPDRKDPTIIQSLSPLICPDAALCSDGISAYAKFAKAAGLSHFVLGAKPGSRKINQTFHIQNVNALHSRLKAFLRPFKGPSTKYVDSYVNWHFVRGKEAFDTVFLDLLTYGSKSKAGPTVIACARVSS